MDPISSSYDTKGTRGKKPWMGLPICPPGPPGERLVDACLLPFFPLLPLSAAGWGQVLWESGTLCFNPSCVASTPPCDTPVWVPTLGDNSAYKHEQLWQCHAAWACPQPPYTWQPIQHKGGNAVSGGAAGTQGHVLIQHALNTLGNTTGWVRWVRKLHGLGALESE